MSATPARRAAFEVLRRVFEDGAWADRALPAALRRAGVTERERGLAQRLAYGAVQRRGTSDWLIGRFAERRPDRLDDPVLAALRLGLYELLFSEAADHAAVDQAVELAKSSPRGKRGAGLVNAVLRRASREGAAAIDSLAEDEPGTAAARHSYPPWLAEKWWGELGPAAALAVMEAGNRPAETALRANTLRVTPDALLAELQAGGVEATPAPGPTPLDVPESIIVTGPLGEAGVAALESDRAVAQSRASAAVVAALDPQPGERVLDLCAGPGVKTSQIAARMQNDGEISAVELQPKRASQVRELCERLGASIVNVVEADAAGSGDLGAGYDRVLVDPPCSDLGTLASRPDARWRKEPGDPDRLAAIQSRILARGADALRPGGTLVYSTCTISAPENEDLIGSFTAGNSGWSADSTQLRPDLQGSDGFFTSRLTHER